MEGGLALELCKWDGSERLGFTGKEEKGPDVVPRPGGRPRVFPVDDPLLVGQADETAGP